MIEKLNPGPWFDHSRDLCHAEPLSPLPPRYSTTFGAPSSSPCSSPMNHQIHDWRHHPPGVDGSAIVDFADRQNQPENSVAIQLAMASRLLDSGHYAAGRKWLKGVLRLAPFYAPAIRLFATSFERQQDFTNAYRCYLVIANRDLNFRNLADLGHTLYDLGRDDEAQACYQMALKRPLEVDHRLFKLYKNLGNIFVKQKDLEGAEEIYNRALAIEPRSDVLYVNLGTLAIQRDHWEEARGFFREAVSINSRNDRAWVGLALVHHYFADHELAWANIEEALAVNPCNEAAVNLVTDWAIQQGKLGKAEQILKNYLAIKFNDVAMSLNLVKVFLIQGHQAHAEIELERALALAPHSAEISEIYWSLRKKRRSGRDV